MLKLKAHIQDNSTGLIYQMEFPTLRHAENFINNERIAIGREYIIIKINGEEIEQWKRENLQAV
jgi:hypothetical protein